MTVHDFNAQRLFLEAPLGAGAKVSCTPEQANYLVNVLRMRVGEPILVFNGRDGEWRAQLVEEGKRRVGLIVGEQTRVQESGPEIDYLFAPLKRARLDYMVQKATELGAARLAPVITRHTIAERVNLERMRANVIEAAEQCGILRVPEIAEPTKLEAALAAWDKARPLIFCDEGADSASPLDVLKDVPPGPVGVLVGPEGGFAAEERKRLLGLPSIVRISLGPRIMRADTAAIAALALINATIGDWRG